MVAILAFVLAGLMMVLAISEKMMMLYLFAVGFGIVSGLLNPPTIALSTFIFDSPNLSTLIGILMISWGLGSVCG
jgi:MFS family permease